MRLRAAWLFASALVLASGPIHAQIPITWYVSTTGDDITGDGSSANPYRTIQTGVDAAAPGDTVQVAPGTYNECVDALTASVTIVAEDSLPGNDRIDTTIIDGAFVCDTASGFPGPTVSVGDGSRLEGFTVQGGGDSGVFGVGSVVITRNVITGNSAGYGGGVYAYSDTFSAGTTPLEISSNTISGNTASFDGGGLFVYSISASGLRREVDIDDNIVQSNTADGELDGGSGFAGGHGGGMVLFSNTSSAGESRIVVTRNLIDGNSANINVAGYVSYGGGIWASTFGYGNESIEIIEKSVDDDGDGIFVLVPNQITNNTSQGDGGGVSAWIQGYNPVGGPQTPIHTMTVQGNTISANDAADGGGGGLDLFMSAQDLPSSGTALSFTATDNQITGNLADDSDPDFPLGGGGVLATLISWRTDAPILFDIGSNDIRNNVSEFGGGAKLLADADADPDLDGVITARTTAAIQFHHNLVATNDAMEPTLFTGLGGGIVASAQAFGDADAAIDVTFDTLVSNGTDFGSAGIEVAATTDVDANGLFDGNTTVDITNSIVSNNLSGYGIGGVPAGGTGNLTLNITFDDVFGNTLGNYDPLLIPVDPTGTAGDISVDPLLTATFEAGICSPTIDAADPAEPFAIEPDPDGQRANMGHLGSTPSATISLPDPSGDRLVDGVDILAIATSFASDIGQPLRYNPYADIDKDGFVDGNDLSFVASYYGTSCP